MIRLARWLGIAASAICDWVADVEWHARGRWDPALHLDERRRARMVTLAEVAGNSPFPAESRPSWQPCPRAVAMHGKEQPDLTRIEMAALLPFAQQRKPGGATPARKHACDPSANPPPRARHPRCQMHPARPAMIAGDADRPPAPYGKHCEGAVCAGARLCVPRLLGTPLPGRAWAGRSSTQLPNRAHLRSE